MKLKIVAKVECHKTIFEQRLGFRAPSIYFYADEGCEVALAFFSTMGSALGFISLSEIGSMFSDADKMGLSIECSVDEGDLDQKVFNYSWANPQTVREHLNDLFGDNNYKDGVWSCEVKNDSKEKQVAN